MSGNRILGDFHAHLCYGVDDGPFLETQVHELIDIAAASGTTHICATPHIIELAHVPAWEQIVHQVEQHRAYIKRRGYNLNIYPGAEVYLNPELLPHFGNGAYCLNGGHYILVELPLGKLPNCTEDFWYQLRLRGLRPIIAHPERYWSLMCDLELLYKWRAEGIICQCNIGSFAGEFGQDVCEAVQEMAKAGLVDLIGSDAHFPGNRNTDMSHGLAVLKTLLSEREYLRITHFNPLAVLRDEILELPSLSKLRKKFDTISYLKSLFE